MRSPLRRFAALLVALAACGGSCSSCLSPIPGGFPVDGRRHAGAMQVRVTGAALDTLSADAPALLATLGGADGGPSATSGAATPIDVPASCGGSNEICCLDGAPQTCVLDVGLETVTLTPDAATDALALAVTTTLKSEAPIPITVHQTVTAKCYVAIDTSRGSSHHDVELTTDVDFSVDGTTSLTRLDLANTTLANLDESMLDITPQSGITNQLACGAANVGAIKTLIISELQTQLATQLAAATDALCPSCAAQGDCDGWADGCASGRCQRMGKCLQEIGVAGRLDLGAALGALSPGSAAALDTLAVLGGYADATAAPAPGLSFGLLGGGEAAPHDACVPVRTAPAAPAVANWAEHDAETEPAGALPFDVGVGVHASHLNTLGFAAFDAGVLCLHVGTATSALLDANTLTLLIPSLADLTHGDDAPAAVAVRPQHEPVITLGAGTFTTDASGAPVIADPLLHVALPQLALDFYVTVDERPIRVMTLTADVAIGVALDVDAEGRIVPLIGDLSKAFTNLAVTNSELLAEAPGDLASAFPTLLGLAAGQLGKALSPIALPSVGGLDLSVVAIEPTDGETFLSIFTTLAPATRRAARRVRTEASITGVMAPPARQFAVGARADADAPSVALALGGDGGGPLEWSWSLDGLPPTPWSPMPHPTIRSPLLWLAGEHRLAVHARRQGAPESADERGVTLGFAIAPAHADATIASSGCRVASGGEAIALLAASLAFARRRRRAAFALSAALATASACTCSSPAKLRATLTTGQLESPRDEIGRYSDTRAAGGTLFVSAYDDTHGDLAYAEVDEAAITSPIQWQWVDGVPLDVKPDRPGSYRNGTTALGDDVGRYTSLALTAAGDPRIAYFDATHGALKYAFASDADRVWTAIAVDAPATGTAGYYASLSLDAAGVPSIAYVVTGVPAASGGGFVSHLRLATAKSASPASAADFTFVDVDTDPIPCAGTGTASLCAAGDACVDVDPGTPAKSVCRTVTTDCAAACDSGDACVAGACVPTLSPVAAPDLTRGIGLFASLHRLSHGARVVAYYDRERGNCRLATETTPGAFTTVTVDADPARDLGRFVSASVASDDTVHVIYEDASRGALVYRGVKGVTVAAAEVVDDGTRADGPHPVGSGAVLADGADLVVAYQDQATADLWLARRAAGTWTTTSLHAGAAGYGFYPRVVADGGALFVTDFVYDRAAAATTGVLGSLEIVRAP